MEDSGDGRSRRYDLDEETNAQPAPASLTLGGILSIKQTPPYRIQDRTLLDLIRDDQTCGKEPKTTWKMIREKLRLKLAGSVCTTTAPTLASLIPITTESNRLSTRHGSTHRNSTDESTWQLNSPQVTNSSNIPDTQTARVQTDPPVEESEQTSTEENRVAGGEGEPAAARMSLMSLLEVDGSAYLDYEEGEAEEVEEEEVEEGGGGGGGEPAAARMSLMSLLEVDGSAYLDYEEGEAEEVEEEEVEEGGGGGGGYKYNNCCVCMVRHKGAAFIPCGHTFCRLCSRELFVQRASCPLCNNLILEILDIF